MEARNATPDDAARQERIGMAAAATAAILFGTSYVATAFALRGLSPVGVAFWRGLVAAVVMAPLVLLAARRARAAPHRAPWPSWPSWPQLWRLGALGFLSGAVFVLAMNEAVALAGASIAAFVAGLYAVLAALLAPLVLRERLGPSVILGFAAALLGTWLLAELTPSGTSAAGIGAGLAAAGAFGLYLVMSRRWIGPWRLDAGHVALSSFVWTAIGMLAVQLAVGGGANGLVPRTLSFDVVGGVLWLALLPGVASQLLIVASVRRIAARRSSAFLLLNPPSAAIVAWLLLGETLRPGQLAGGALVLLGIALASAPASWRPRGAAVSSEG